MVLWLAFNDFYSHIYLYGSKKDHCAWLCTLPAKCIPLQFVQFGVYFLKAESSSIFFSLFSEKGGKITSQKFVPLQIGGSLGIYSNALANLVFLNMCTHTYCPLSELLNTTSRKC